MKAYRKQLRVYHMILSLYPEEYRQNYGSEMVQTFEDMLTAQTSRLGRLSIWLRTLRQLPWSVANENAMILQAAFTDSTPRYVKRNTEISALLLLPFFAIIITNGLFHHVVTNENAWRYMLMFAVVGLPIVALLLIGATFLRWLHDQQKAKQSLRHSLFDFKHSWMMLAVGGLALLLVAFMFGHDSVHCFIRNPAYLATHTHQTWQCASDGFLGGK